MTASFPHATKMLGISREDALAASFSPDALVRRALPSHLSAPVPRPPSATQPTPGGETKRAPLSATVMAAASASASASDIVGVPTTLPINQVGASPGSTANLDSPDLFDSTLLHLLPVIRRRLPAAATGRRIAGCARSASTRSRSRRRPLSRDATTLIGAIPPPSEF
jgi:hypothetical protein